MKKFIILFAIMLSFAATTFAIMENNTDYMDMAFWEKFGDEYLIENLQKVYENNNDLKSATLKVQEAQRIIKMSFAQELPHLGFEGYIGRTFKSSDEVFGDIVIPDYTQSHFLFPLTLNYEIDLWGQNHLKTKSKKKEAQEFEEDKRAAYIYISSAYAIDYFNLIRMDRLIEKQKELILLQENVLKSYETKYKLGTSTISDIDSAQKNLAFMKEDLEKYREKQDILKNQLSVLISDRAFEDIKRKKDDFDIDLKTPESIDFTLLDKRPDRVKSELELERRGIDIKIARRDFLPKFVITGNLGFNMYNSKNPHSFLADIGVVPVWDVFSGGKKVQMLKIKKDQYNLAIENYEKTILKSIQEANDALFAMKTADNIKKTTTERLECDKRELNHTEIKKDAGVSDNLDILFAKEHLINTQKQDIISDTNKIISALNLYRALGGVDFLEEI